MISRKIQIQKYKKIHKGAKYVRNPHILRTLSILHFLGLIEICWDFIWVGYCLNSFIKLRRCSNDFWKNPSPKILKNLTRVQRIWGFLTFFLPSQFSTSLIPHLLCMHWLSSSIGIKNEWTPIIIYA